MNYGSVKKGRYGRGKYGCLHGTKIHHMKVKAAAKAKPRPKSGFYGVSASSKRFQTTMCHDGKTINLGSFNTKQEAAFTYDNAVKKHKGADAVCNFASEEEGEAAASLAASEWQRENPQVENYVKPRPKSGFYGVSASGRRWKATLCFNGERYQLGSYNTKEEAAATYDKTSRKRKVPESLCNYGSLEEAEAAASLAVSE